MIPLRWVGATSALALALALVAAPAAAQQPPRAPLPAASPAAAAKPEARDRSAGPLAGLSMDSKEPIKIDSDRLDVYDREGRAVFTGNVVAVQGDSTIRCTKMSVFYDKPEEKARSPGAPRAAAAPKTPAASSPNDASIKKIDCTGPVTVASKTQTATGDNATFDKAANKVFLTGNAALTDGPNVTRGDRIVYDLDTGIANIETNAGGRVKALFVPGGGSAGAPRGDAKPGSSPAAPTPAAARRTPAATN